MKKYKITGKLVDSLCDGDVDGNMVAIVTLQDEQQAKDLIFNLALGRQYYELKIEETDIKGNAQIGDYK